MSIKIGCVFCTRAQAREMCSRCCVSYDRSRARGGTVLGAMEWAAKRVRWHERKRATLALRLGLLRRREPAK